MTAQPGSSLYIDTIHSNINSESDLHHLFQVSVSVISVDPETSETTVSRQYVYCVCKSNCLTGMFDDSTNNQHNNYPY